jgi:hypothetical protein
MHKTRDGIEIRIKDMEESHLRNVIALHHRKAREGMEILEGGGVDFEEMWCERYRIYGQEVFDWLGTREYERELARREVRRRPTTPRVQL